MSGWGYKNSDLLGFKYYFSIQVFEIPRVFFHVKIAIFSLFSDCLLTLRIQIVLTDDPTKITRRRCDVFCRRHCDVIRRRKVCKF